MKAAGVIVEYNPFHNGHLYHLQQTRKETKADCIVAVMSGNFLQRGEPALVSKWTRTRMALLAGVDLVIELPYAFATQKAEIFANGAISILEALGVDEVCFGSESGDINSFLQTLQVMQTRVDEFDTYVQGFVKDGNSFPKSASKAFHALEIKEEVVDLSLPNNILGYHYVKSIHDQQAKIIPKTITRTGSNYHDEHFQSPSIASATSIRKALFSPSGTLDEIKDYIPESTYHHLVSDQLAFQHFRDWESYFQLLKYKVLSSSSAELECIYEIEEGLEHRIISQIKSAESFHAFMEGLKTKRYTWTRLQRACTHLLTNTSKKVMKDVLQEKKAHYIRLLGMSEKGRTYLQENKKKATLPIISKLSGSTNAQLELDIKASQIYNIVADEPIRSNLLHSEYATPPIQYDSVKREFSH
ncbi:putative nucleotidyltransferase [Bacillus mesophilus]|uniref:tRNA(Met) cytidine acetate ligase n=1 Tax=Bacillus mesophilus TaxID=1808955 RepID=A0A6M0Q4H4_9BACI|nr:nucleotidyltransferase [Bacillus mesophilus]MBM7659477.1 putative nucleotidyltransferase [Bacillus mesophilus]NEY70350.1 nucleotidyltransferase [Bacillus mesophilus]